MFYKPDIFDVFFLTGGGTALLCGLAACAQKFQATPHDHTHLSVIPQLGLQKALKPYKDGSGLVNFFPEGK